MSEIIKQEDKTWSLDIHVSESYFCGEWYLDISQGKGRGAPFLKVKKQGAPELIRALQGFIGGDAEPKLKKGDHAVWLKSHSRSSEVFKIDTDKSGKMGMRPASKKEIEQGFRDG